LYHFASIDWAPQIPLRTLVSIILTSIVCVCFFSLFLLLLGLGITVILDAIFYVILGNSEKPGAKKDATGGYLLSFLHSCVKTANSAFCLIEPHKVNVLLAILGLYQTRGWALFPHFL